VAPACASRRGGSLGFALAANVYGNGIDEGDESMHK
jgi:hypothetical protein